MNVNFPDRLPKSVAGIRMTSQGKRDQTNLSIDARVDTRGTPYFWTGFKRILSNPDAGTDLRAIYDGYVSVTPLHLNLTETPTLAAMQDLFAAAKPKRRSKA
jgi:5'-nucleotidase